MRPTRRLTRRLCIHQMVIRRVERLQLLHGGGVVDPEVRPCGAEPWDHRETRGAANVVGVRLERHAEHRHDFVPHDPQRRLELREQPLDSCAVDALDLLEHPAVHAVLFGDLDERAQVFGQAGATEAEARIQELASDPWVQSDTACDRGHVHPKGLA